MEKLTACIGQMLQADLLLADMKQVSVVYASNGKKKQYNREIYIEG